MSAPEGEAAPKPPPGYRVRPPTAGEAPEVNRLAAMADGSVGAAPTLSEDLIRQLWARPRFHLRRDAWVVDGDGEMVGYAEVWDHDPGRASGFAVVHPDHLGRGIGTALAATIERRAAEKLSGGGRLLSAVVTEDVVGARLLAGRGYRFARRFWHMEADLERITPPTQPSAGIRLRSLEPDHDLPAAHRILEEAFEDHWDFTPTSYEEFLAQQVDQDEFDPELWVVALDADDPVGVLAATGGSERGWIEDVGVLRSNRGRGIATAMLEESLARFRRRGRARVRLNVDSENPSRAVSLYERVGFRVASSYDLWERPIL